LQREVNQKKASTGRPKVDCKTAKISRKITFLLDLIERLSKKPLTARTQGFIIPAALPEKPRGGRKISHYDGD